MRTPILLAICSIISAGFVIGIEFGLFYVGITIPYFDWILFDLIKFALILPIVIILLKALNETIKFWRLERWRDIDAEELYETESGFLSISEKENNVSRLLEK